MFAYNHDKPQSLSTPFGSTFNTPRRGLGYLAFPPGPKPSTPEPRDPTPPPQKPNAEDASDDDGRPEWERENEARRRKRLEIERKIGSESEFDWVRSGGILRDANHERDYVRTAQIKAEIQLQEQEARVLSFWDSYESRWRALSRSQTPLTFSDIPWPVITNEGSNIPPTLDDLTREKITKFFLDPLNVRSVVRAGVTKRDRVRAALLRWHPDKLSSVLSRVVEEDEEPVREAVGAVVRTLKSMLGGE